MDWIILRNAMGITLSITLVIGLLRRYRAGVLAQQMPAPMHAELLDLLVEYHPARLRVTVKVPALQQLNTSVLDADHRPLHSWDPANAHTGESVRHRALPELPDGTYFLELATATQRTVRQFRLQQV
jgi:hypothetical protein